MGKSQYEQDVARRQRAQGKKPDGKGIDKRIWIALGAVAVAAVLIFAATGGGPAMTRDGNVAAFGLADDPYLGAEDAPVVLVGFESLSCPSCQHFHRTVLPTLQPLFDDGTLVYYYVATPLYEDPDFALGNAQECAFAISNQAFWDFTDRAYAGNLFSEAAALSALRQVAMDHESDPDDAAACLDDQTHHRRVSGDWRTADDFGANATPTFYLFGPEGEAVQVTRDKIADAAREMA